MKTCPEHHVPVRPIWHTPQGHRYGRRVAPKPQLTGYACTFEGRLHTLAVSDVEDDENES